MRTLVTLAVLALALTGCLKDDAKKVAVRDGFIRLQASVNGGVTQLGLQNALTDIDTAIRIAVADGAIPQTQGAELAQVVETGRQVAGVWRVNFGCKPVRDYFPKSCLFYAIVCLQALGMTDEQAKEIGRREEGYDEMRDGQPIAAFKPKEAVSWALTLYDAQISKALATLQH